MLLSTSQIRGLIGTTLSAVPGGTPMRRLRPDAMFPLILILFATSAFAQLNRTAVSVQGSDLNTCAVAFPCRNFAAALMQTNAGGEIIALDSGGFGTVTVNRSVTIAAAPGVYAGITVPSGAIGVWVLAPAGTIVVVRGLNVKGVGGVVGIHLNSGQELHVENCVIDSFNEGIANYSPSSDHMTVSETTIRNVHNGITLSGPALIDHVTVKNVSNIGIESFGTGLLTVRNSVVTGGNAGFWAGSSTLAQMNIENCAAFDLLTGVGAGAGGHIRLSNSVVTRNTTGLILIGTGVFETFQNNHVRGNGTDVNGTLTQVSQN
jgi:hypothetical protein